MSPCRPMQRTNPLWLVTAIAALCASGSPTAAAPRPTEHAEIPDSRDLTPNLPRLAIDQFFTPFEAERELRSAPPGADLELGGFNESVVVVNPLDPTNIIYASLFEMRGSTDGGATFWPPIPTLLPDVYIPQGDPCLTFDSQGRLFWQYLASPGTVLSFTGYDIFVVPVDPANGALLGNPVNVTVQIGLPASAGNFNDKAWLTADAWPGSPFQDRLYLVWSNLPSGGGSFPYVSYSSDHGLTWSAATQLGPSGPDFKWPVHVAVAPNGDVYAANHRQPGFVGGVPDGISGRVLLLRSTDGGATFSQQTNAAPAGDADITFNQQNLATRKIPGAVFVTTGSVQPWVLPDPLVPGRVSVVYVDDPDDPNSGDASNVYLARSTDSGLTWSPRVRVDSGQGTTFQLFPNATIDRSSGAIAVTWFDNRGGALNGHGHYLLDVHGAVSLNGGASFGGDFRINDTPFDPDAGAPCRYSCAGILKSCWSDSPTLAYATGYGGTSGVQRWNGSSWVLVNTGGTNSSDVWATDASHVWVVGLAGQIRTYNGTTWSGQASGTGADLIRVHGTSASDIFAVGTGGAIVHYNGGSWSPQTSGTSQVLFGVHALPGGTAWAVGFNGTVLHYTGGVWSPENIGATENLMGVWAFSDADVWICGGAGNVYHGNGSTWTRMSTGSAFLLGAWGTSAANLYFGSISGLVHWNGSSFQRESFSEASVSNIFGSSASNIFAVGGSSAIGHFDGTSWTLQPNPGEATNPTLRIGEYNGIGTGGIAAVTTWTGNTRDASSQAVDQQSFFDSFDFDHQVSAPTLAPIASLVLLDPGKPNPFRWVTTISYALPEESRVRLSVHDVAGRLVSTLENGVRSEGRHDVSWDGRDTSGGNAAAGVYFVRLETSRASQVSKIALVR